MIAAEAVRGGVVEQLGDASYSMVLRWGEIERFEDKYRSIFDLWDGFYRGGTKPTSNEVRDIVALGLVGGGLSDEKADKVVADLGVAGLLNLYQIANGILGTAFMPEIGDDVKKKVKSRKRGKSTSEK